MWAMEIWLGSAGDIIGLGEWLDLRFGWIADLVGLG